jgi:NADH-quinone oxidoreductase subunit M
MFLISTIITLPIIGAIFTACCDKEKIENSFSLNKIIVLINSLISCKLLCDYINYGNFQESFFLLNVLGVFNLGIDALSLLLLLTLNLLFAFVLILNKNNLNHEDSRTNQAWYMVLYVCLLGAFLSKNLLLFYIFFEITIIPIFFLLFKSEDAEKTRSAYKYLFYSFVSSIPMLLSILFILNELGSVNLSEIHNLPINLETQKIAIIGFLISLGVKIPLLPFNTWITSTYKNADSKTVLILSSLISKMAPYALITFVTCLFKDAFLEYRNILIALSLISSFYSAVCAYYEKNLKTMLAYASMSHMGMFFAGLSVFNLESIMGSYIFLISHSFVSFGMFLFAEILFAKVGSYEIGAFSGLAKTLPKFSSLKFLMFLGFISFPLSLSFIAEFLIMFGAFKYCILSCLILLLINIISAIYPLKILAKTIWGEASPVILKDISLKEQSILSLILGVVFFLGIYPKPIIKFLESDIKSQEVSK